MHVNLIARRWDVSQNRAERPPFAAAAEPGAAYLAAGTNLLDLMKGGITRPSRLVDVTRLPRLDRIERLPDGGMRIGAIVRFLQRQSWTGSRFVCAPRWLRLPAPRWRCKSSIRWSTRGT